MPQKERNSSFELLRIISMVLIVSFHYVYHAGFEFLAPFSPRLYFIQCIDMGVGLGVLCYLTIFVYIFACDLLRSSDFSFKPRFDLFRKENTIFIFMTSILLFIVFSKWNPGNIKWINYISPATFGVYLIHDNVVMRPFYGKIC